MRLPTGTLWFHIEVFSPGVPFVAGTSFKEKNQLCGRRGVNLEMPIDWPAVGFYSISSQGNLLYVTERFSGVEVPIRGTTGVSLDQVEPIEENWSKTNASLPWADGRESIELYQEFAVANKAHLLATPEVDPAQKRGYNMIEDGKPDEAGAGCAGEPLNKTRKTKALTDQPATSGASAIVLVWSRRLQSRLSMQASLQCQSSSMQ